MNAAHTWSIALCGMEGHPVRVEAHVSGGLPSFTLVGLGDTAIREARDRVRAAVGSCAITWPDQRAVVNLSPGALPKTGTGYDLAMAIAVMAAAGHLDRGGFQDIVHLGELGLDGRVLPLRGILPAVWAAVRTGRCQIVVPSANYAEAALVPGAQIRAVDHLGELLQSYGAQARIPRGLSPEEPLPAGEQAPRLEANDLSEVRGQPEARLALEVAAAGGHHLLLLGAPGAGKTMLATRLPGLLPGLDEQASVEVTALHSLAGSFSGQGGLITVPPFQAPHHSATLPAMVGGGSGTPRPGAISLAHRGVLFLDEAPEFAVRVLDALRQPLESGQVILHRAAGQASYPARFQLVLAANPCPCGYAGSKRGSCTCTPIMRRRYLDRLSGPLLDRIDIQIHVDSPTRGALALDQQVEDTATVASRVAVARRAQGQRWQAFGWRTNAEIPGPFLRSPENGIGRALQSRVDEAVERGQLSMRGADRILRLAWTIADLNGHQVPQLEDLGKAVALRNQGI